VDLNPLAVELAKLSLWLTTVATDQPLNFLDHHLRVGNSLIGARLDQLSSLPDRKGEAEAAQIEFSFGPDFVRVVAETIQEIARIVGEASRDVAAVKCKETRWQVEVLPRLAPYKKVADLWTDTFFGQPLSQEDYLARAQAILEAAHRNAGCLQEPAGRYHIKELDKPSFHWELEFPDVFFNEDGSPRANPGFDALIGNPPWLGLRTGEIEKRLLGWLRGHYTSAVGQFDLAAVFTELACRLTAKGAPIGLVVPKRILTNECYERVRQYLAVERYLRSAVDLGVAFVGVDNDAAILISGGSPPADGITLLGKRAGATGIRLTSVAASAFRAMPFHIIPINSDTAAINLAAKLLGKGVVPLGQLAEITRGAECGMNHPAISRRPAPGALRLIDHLDMERHYVGHGGWYVDPAKIEASVLKPAALYQRTPKVLIRFLSASLVAAVDHVGYASTNLVYHVHCGEEAFFLCALLCSRLLSFWYRTAFQNEEVKFPHVQKSHLVRIPIPRFGLGTPTAERRQLVRRGRVLSDAAAVDGNTARPLRFVEQQLAANRGEVARDLLALLAERMAGMNRRKQTAARQFLADLKDFHGIDVHALKPKTRLDHFWKLETAELFAHLRQNARVLTAQNVRLNQTDEDRIRARFQAAKDKLLPLEAELAFTDRLIDQIVYQLYGLTPEEIALVEGKP
jgi:hypothetical protein